MCSSRADRVGMRTLLTKNAPLHVPDELPSGCVYLAFLLRPAGRLAHSPYHLVLGPLDAFLFWIFEFFVLFHPWLPCPIHLKPLRWPYLSIRNRTHQPVPFTAQPRNFCTSRFGSETLPIHLRGLAHRQDFLDYLFTFFVVKE